LFKPKHVGAFIVNLNVNFNTLKQLNCALVTQIEDFDNTKMHGATVKRNLGLFHRTCSVTCWGETGEKLNELGAKLGILLTITERISVPPVRFSAEHFNH